MSKFLDRMMDLWYRNTVRILGKPLLIIPANNYLKNETGSNLVVTYEYDLKDSYYVSYTCGGDVFRGNKEELLDWIGENIL